MEIIEYKNAPRVPIQFEARKLCDRKDIEVIHIVIEEGKILDRHKNPTDVVFYVLSGKGIFEAGDRRYILSENACIQIEGEMERGWINTGKGDLVLLVIKIK